MSPTDDLLGTNVSLIAKQLHSHITLLMHSRWSALVGKKKKKALSSFVTEILLLWRVSVPTLRIEVVAILSAQSEHSWAVIIHTDSKSSLQALLYDALRHSVSPITGIYSLLQNQQEKLCSGAALDFRSYRSSWKWNSQWSAQMLSASRLHQVFLEARTFLEEEAIKDAKG